MTTENMYARVLQLRADGLSFRAIEGKMLKAFNLSEPSKGYRAFNLLKKAKAAQKAAKKKTAAAPALKAKTAKAKKTAAAAVAAKATS